MNNCYPNIPKYIQIETNTICNGSCNFCQQKSKGRAGHIMPDKIWRKIIDDTRNYGIIYRPFMINEPFTDERMGEILEYINKDKTAKIEFNTNGALITDDIASMIIENKVSIMRFSIDGYNEKTIFETRGIPKVKIYDAVLNFIEKNKNAEKPAKIEVRMINNKKNVNEQKTFYNFWNKKVDKVIFPELYNYPWTKQKNSIKAQCPKIFNEMFFRYDGYAVLCCWDTYGKGIIESITDKKVLDIWSGNLINNYRDILHKGDRSLINLCSRCDAYKELTL